MHYGRVSAVNGVTGSVIFYLEGTVLENLFGMAVCGRPDLNGDGVGEFTVGVPHDDDAGVNAGKHMLYAGGIGVECGLQLIGTPSQGSSVRLLHGGLPLADSLVLADVSNGPIPISPYGTIALGWTPFLTVFNDSLGIMGPSIGSGFDTQGAVTMGPFVIPPQLVGATVYMQGFSITPLAPNGLFQISDGLEITFLP